MNTGSKHSQYTRKNRYFDFKNPESHEFDIELIAHSLSNLCRYNGYTNDFYSVAQHSVLVSSILGDDLALSGLMHDASESMTGDMASPFKSLLPDFKFYEQKIESAICKYYSLPHPIPKEVMHADLVILRTEVRDLLDLSEEDFMSSPNWAVAHHLDPIPEIIIPLQPKAAMQMFMDQYEKLSELQHNASMALA